LQNRHGRPLGICLFIEAENSIIAKPSLQLVSIAKELDRRLMKGVNALIIGEGTDEIAAELINYGVDIVWAIEDAQVRPYMEDTLVELVTLALRKIEPEIFLGGATILGRSLFPRIAVRLETGLTADCMELELDPDNNLIQIRPASGDSLVAKIITPARRPQMATVRPGIFSLPLKGNYQGKVIQLPNEDIAGSKLNLVDSQENDIRLDCLEEAKIIVAAGRGFLAPGNLELGRRFAACLGGAFGVTRAIVDEGWIDYPYQIGLSGKIVAPKLYIACGISGAVQHRVGIRNSQTVIAINNDPQAGIFDIADYGIVGDLFQVIPAIMEGLTHYGNDPEQTFLKELKKGRMP
jgi:electron transfer flavoprotein alpha subunit